MPARTRVLDDTTVNTVARVLTLCNGTTQTITRNGPYSGLYQEMQDIITPRFGHLRNKGVIINNPMTRKHNFHTFGGAGYKRTRTPLLPCSTVDNPTTGKTADHDHQSWDTTTLYSPPGGGLGFNLLYNDKFSHSETVPTDFGWGSLVSEASTQALANANASTAQGLVIVKEFQKTLDTLRNPLKATTDFLSKVVRGGRKSGNARSLSDQAKQLGKAASGQHLAIIFGVMPMIQDVEQVMKALEKKIVERQTSRGLATITKTYTENLKMAYNWNGNGLDVADFKKDVIFERTVKAGVLTDLTGQCSLSKRLGFGFSDIPPAIWEVIPFSFVVDYFVNVQQVIGALSVLLELKPLSSWLTTIDRVTVKRYMSNNVLLSQSDPTQDWILNRPSDSWTMCIYETYTRVPNSLVGNIGLVFKPRLDTFRTLALTSLIVQQLTR